MHKKLDEMVIFLTSLNTLKDYELKTNASLPYLMEKNKPRHESNAIIPIYKPISKDAFREINIRANNSFRNAKPVFYKDGKNFFRSASFNDMQTNALTKRSLQHYTPSERKSMLKLTPAEIVALNFHNALHYFQPSTSKSEESLKTYEMDPVIFRRDQESVWPGVEQSRTIYLPNLIKEVS